MAAASFLELDWPVSREGYVWVIGTPTGARVSRGGVLMPSGYTSDWVGAFGKHLMPFLIPLEQLHSPVHLDPLELQDQFESGEPVAIGVQNGKRYRPLEDAPTIFLEFSDLNGTFSEIIRFANRFGSLGGDSQIQFVLEDDSGFQSRLWGETLTWWTSEAAEIRNVTDLWVLAQEGTPKDLKGLLEEGKDGEIYLSFPDFEVSDGEEEGNAPVRYIDFDRFRALHQKKAPTAEIKAFWSDQIAQNVSGAHEIVGQGLVASKDFHPERRPIVKRLGARAAINFFVADLINAGLKARASPRIGWSHIDRSHQLTFTPHSLLGTIWLQLAMAIAENRDYRVCGTCGSWFEVAPGRGRPNKTYCSNACRMRAYRKRKAEGGS